MKSEIEFFRLYDEALLAEPSEFRRKFFSHKDASKYNAISLEICDLVFKRLKYAGSLVQEDIDNKLKISDSIHKLSTKRDLILEKIADELALLERGGEQCKS